MSEKSNHNYTGWWNWKAERTWREATRKQKAPNGGHVHTPLSLWTHLTDRIDRRSLLTVAPDANYNHWASLRTGFLYWIPASGAREYLQLPLWTRGFRCWRDLSPGPTREEHTSHKSPRCRTGAWAKEETLGCWSRPYRTSVERNPWANIYI